MTDDAALIRAGLLPPDWEKRPVFEVVVGNVGTVYTGDDPVKAATMFEEYVTLSKHCMASRACGEPVTLLEDGQIADEWQEALHED